MRDYEHVAQVLGLSELVLYSGALTKAESALGTRLRTLKDASGGVGASSVVMLAESAWVAAAQNRLEKRMGVIRLRDSKPRRVQGQPFEQGYALAREFRIDYGLGERPIESMRALAEEVLGITVMHGKLQKDIAGATLDVDGTRVIVLNDQGANGRVAVRRATIAHEICHLLYDPEVDLKSLRVDQIDNQGSIENFDAVEQRANAFAAELLLPRSVILAKIDTESFSSLASEYGVSITLAQYQAFNAESRRRGPGDYAFVPLRDEEWDGPESYTTIYSPLPELVEHPLRAGRFAAVVVRAVELGLISEDSGSEWLKSGADLLISPGVKDSYSDLYADVWDQSA
ncbi:MAG: ImmA/IrrE family metallo-endopeptidase [Pseudoclavibacter sp.]